MTQTRFGLGVLAGLAVLALIGCRPPHAIIEIHDPDGLATSATRVLVGTNPADLAERDRGDLDFPMTVRVEADEEGRHVVWIDAAGSGDSVLGRARVEVDVRTEIGAVNRADLARPCEGADHAGEEIDERCEVGDFCTTGPERCIGRVCVSGFEPCPEPAFDCFELTCVEEERRCRTTVDHLVCADRFPTMAGFDDAYCDTAIGCARGTPCYEDDECDDMAVCTGTEQCVGGRCVLGQRPDVDDGNPCTIDACTEPDGEAHFDEADGLPCNQDNGDPGACLAGTCVPAALVVPDSLPFALRDPASNSATVTLTTTVDVQVQGSVDGSYRLSEDPTLPAADDPGFGTTAPTTFTLSSGDGEKRVYLWTLVNGLVSPTPTEATIYLSSGIVRVGSGATDCPTATASPCHIYPAQGPHPLQRAVDLATPGEVVWLYPATLSIPNARQLIIDKSAVIEAAPGVLPDEVHLRASSGGHYGGAIGLTADDVTLRGFTVIVASFNTHYAINAENETTGPTTGHVIDRMRFRGANEPGSYGTGVYEALALRSNTVVSNCVFDGFFEGAASAIGETSPVTGFVFVHNTVMLDPPKVGLRIHGTSGSVVRNNVFWAQNAGGAFAIGGDTDTTGSTVEGTIWNYDVAVDPDVPAGVNTVQVPGLRGARDPRPVVGSPAIGTAVAAPNAGGFDFYGAARSAAGPFDVGAVAADASPPDALGPDVRVGETATSCPVSTGGACDFHVGNVVEQDLLLPTAVREAPAGATITLYGSAAGGMATYLATNVYIGRPLTVRADPAAARGDVRVRVPSYAGYGFQVAMAEGVRFEGFDCVIDARQDLCVRTRYCPGENCPLYQTPRGVQISRLRAYGFEGLESAIFVLADDAEVRGSLVRAAGPAVLLRGAGGRVIGNTLLLQPWSGSEPPAAIGMWEATDSLIANNAVVALDVAPFGDFIGTGPSTANNTFRHNQIWNVATVDTPYATVLGTGDNNCSDAAPVGPDQCAADPLLTDVANLNVTPLAGSPLIDAGDSTLEDPSALDLNGDPRINGVAVDVGAVETP